jgi:hypothetical protein
VRYPVSKTGGPSGLGGSTPSPSARGGMAEPGKAARCYRVGGLRAARRFESCCLRLIRSGVVELERRAVVTRESAGSSPAAGACFVRKAGNPHPRTPRRAEIWAPVVEVAMTPGPQPGSCGFESRRGYSLIVFWL